MSSQMSSEICLSARLIPLEVAPFPIRKRADKRVPHSTRFRFVFLQGLSEKLWIPIRSLRMTGRQNRCCCSQMFAVHVFGAGHTVPNTWKWMFHDVQKFRIQHWQQSRIYSEHHELIPVSKHQYGASSRCNISVATACNHQVPASSTPTAPETMCQNVAMVDPFVLVP